MPTALAGVPAVPDFSNTSPATPVPPLLSMQPTPKTLIFALQ